VRIEAPQLRARLDRGAQLRLGGEPGQVGEQHTDPRRRSTRRRQLDAGRAEVRVLARRSVAKGTHDPGADARERRTAVTAARRARHRAQDSLDGSGARLCREPPVRIPVIRGQRFVGAFSRLLDEALQRVALQEGWARSCTPVVRASAGVCRHTHRMPVPELSCSAWSRTERRVQRAVGTERRTGDLCVERHERICADMCALTRCARVVLARCSVLAALLLFRKARCCWLERRAATVPPAGPHSRNDARASFWQTTGAGSSSPRARR
jgi:hypothetical protein